PRPRAGDSSGADVGGGRDADCGGRVGGRSGPPGSDSARGELASERQRQRPGPFGGRAVTVVLSCRSGATSATRSPGRRTRWRSPTARGGNAERCAATPLAVPPVRRWLHVDFRRQLWRRAGLSHRAVGVSEYGSVDSVPSPLI